MTEIQEIITSLETKIKSKTEDLVKLEREAASMRIDIINERNALLKIVESMKADFFQNKVETPVPSKGL